MILDFNGKKPKIDKTAFVAPTADIIGDVEIGENSSVWFGSVLRGDLHYIKIGRNSNVQDNCVMHGTINKYPTVVGKNVSIGHNAIVHGCEVGDNCIIGMGSIILEGAKIGKLCIIGAGAVVKEGEKIPDKSLVVGVPARVVKKLDKSQLKRIDDNWREYVKLKEVYMNKKF